MDAGLEVDDGGWLVRLLAGTVDMVELKNSLFKVVADCDEAEGLVEFKKASV